MEKEKEKEKEKNSVELKGEREKGRKGVVFVLWIQI